MADDDTRTRLLIAAGELFAAKGYEATNVRAITEQINASPAAVNYHFRSKQHLYVEAVRYAAAAVDALCPMSDVHGDLPAEERLRRFIRGLLNRLFNRDLPAWQRLLIMREVAQPHPGACEDLVQRFIRPTFELLRTVLRDLLPPTVAQVELDLIGSSIAGQCLHYHHARHVLPMLVGREEANGFDIDRLTEHIWRFSLAAIRGLYPLAGESSHGRAD